MAWAGPRRRPEGTHALLELMARRPIVVGELAAAPCSRDDTLRCAEVLGTGVDAVLTGDRPDARVQFPPSFQAALVRTAGVTAWAGINCRDRNRVALEGELAALAALGVGGVHCVTGDHPAVGHRADAQPVFDLDSTELAALARSAGLLVSVIETPLGPPSSARASRVVEKVNAGAQVCFVNHAAGAGAVERFATEVAELLDPGPSLIACVPLLLDHESAAQLAGFPGLALPPGYVDRVLESRHPRRCGIEAAVRLATELLEIPGVRGIDISSAPLSGRELPSAEAVAEVGRALGGVG